MNYRADIDGLRALAVVPVVFYHAGFGPSGGFSGVDIFFVISGFLITKIIVREIEGGQFSILNFYERRVRRLFPALVFMLATTTAASAFFLIPKDLLEYAESAVYALFFLSNIFFYQNIGYFNEAADLKPLLHTWSLGIEEQFYLFFPFFMVLFYTRLSKSFFIILLVSLVGLSFGLGVFLSGTSAGFYLPITRMWELGVGALLAIIYGHINLKDRRIANMVGALGLAMIIAIYMRASSSDAWPGLLALVSCFGAAAVIISGSNSKSITSSILALPPLTGIGRISYSLYLWHWPIIVFANYGRFEEISFYGKVLLVLFSFSMAYFSWRWIEMPVREHPRFKSSAALYKSLLAPLAGTLFALLVFIHLDGLPGRVKAEDRAQWTASHSEREQRYQRCHQVTPERIRNQDLCVRGFEGSAPTFVLVGDSHANALAPAIFDAAARLGMSGYQFTGSGFAPTVGRVRIGNVRRQPILDKRIDAFVEFLSDKPNIKMIYLTGWWHRYATGISYRSNNGIWQDEACNSNLGLDCNKGSLQRSLTRLVRQFPDRRFIFLDDVPTGWALHPNSYYRASFRGLLDSQRAILPISEAQTQYMNYAPILEKLAENNTNSKFMPFIFDNLCDDSGCKMHGGSGELIFGDGDHLSEFGAMLLAKDMRRVMKDAASWVAR